ncbi:EAL and HDOD domain-containing protein [Sulfurimonas sp.]|uniref:EAL and HDOD domain-containing protein n=1 Tax=Sulfurimonas sp. TaxID=2022749 RepID=UPI003565B244
MSILGRQVVNNSSYEIFAYDILYRSDDEDIDSNNLSASATSMAKVLNDFGLENVVGCYNGFLRVDAEFLSNSIMNTISKEQFTLMILQSSFLDKKLIPKLKNLIEKGFRFGLNDSIINKSTIKTLVPLLKYVEYVKIDALHSDEPYVDKLIEYLKSKDKKIIASKIETHDMYELYKQKGVDYFQGYYLKRPNIIKTTSFNASQTQILELWNLIQNNATTKEIVLELEKNHALALKLMQFINSSFFSFRSQISSMNQIINLLGRDALANWLLIFMVSSKDNGDKPNHPLLLMVINRTEIMVGLLKLIKPDSSMSEKSTAYLVGMLSLIHLLFQIEHREFLHKLRVTEEVEEAMFEANGFFGQLLVMTRYIENADSSHINEFIKKYNLNEEDMQQIVSQAMIKVNQFDKMIQETF